MLHKFTVVVFHVSHLYFCSRAGIAPGNAFTFTGNRYLCAFNYKCLAIMENYICFTFHLRNRVMLETVRGKFELF